MSNSKLVDYTKISPNSTNPRNHKIDTITIHHTAGVVSVETLGSIFAKESRQASCNYGIGSDGRVALIVDEANRSWCSSNRDNDHRAITIEVSNSANGGNWPVSDKVLAKLIDLCVDICRRNGIEKLNYTGDKTGNLTMHKWFAATSCPGKYLESKFPYIAEEVNKRLASTVDNGVYSVTVEGLDKSTADGIEKWAKDTGHKVTVTKTDEVTPVKPVVWTPIEGDIVQFKSGTQYSSANATSGSNASAGQAKITRFVAGKKHPYHLVKTGKVGPYGWVDAGTFTKA